MSVFVDCFSDSIRVDGLDVKCFSDLTEAAEIISRNYLSKPAIAVAINPEKIIKARESEEIKKVLMACDFKYPDGIGVVKVMQKKTSFRIARIPGCELWEELMRVAGVKKIPVFLLGAKPKIVSEVKEKLQSLYNVNIVGSHDGYFKSDEEMIELIKASRAKIVTVALGSPRQEIFMLKCKEAGVNAFMMGVGGTYDVFTGHVNRAPRWVCNIHCEWLYRLVIDPTRIFRQIKLLKFAYWYATGKI